jgi:hypothetical protein
MIDADEIAHIGDTVGYAIAGDARSGKKYPSPVTPITPPVLAQARI